MHPTTKKSAAKEAAHDVYIVDGTRTPFLKARGKPGPFAAADLAVIAARSLLVRQPFQPHDVNQVVVGCVGPQADEANIARLIALRVGCGDDIPAFTVQRNCASGLQAVESAAQSIRDGECDLVLAGGTEAMSHSPLLFNKKMVNWLADLSGSKVMSKKLLTATKFRPEFLTPVLALLKGLTDPYVNMNMGQTAEEVAYRFGISRHDMDAFSEGSHQRVIKAQENNLFEEIAPLYTSDGKVIEFDDGVRVDSTIEKLGKLKPVFEKHGTITAGNSSQISDGAAFLILANKKAMTKYHLTPMAKIVDTQWAALDPAIMGMGPIHAMTPLLIKHKLSLQDIDHIEINEAFAAQVLACSKMWGDIDYCKKSLGIDTVIGEIDSNKLNPQGGAIAIGHPVGASGARLALHCAKMIHINGIQRAIASLCIGGGQGGAMLIERA